MSAESAHEFILDLPYPPSVNRIWRSTAAAGSKKVYIAPSYVKWRAEANAMLMAKRGWMMRRIAGPFSVDLALLPPKGHPRGDLDNRIKAVLDFLQAATIIQNDKHCQLIRAYWAPWGQPGCRVTVRPFGPQSMADILKGLERTSELQGAVDTLRRYGIADPREEAAQ